MIKEKVLTKPKSYECWIDNFHDGMPLISTHVATTPAKAKYEFYLEHRDVLLPYKECFRFIKQRCLGKVHPIHFFTKDIEGFTRMCARRQISFAYLGMGIVVDGRRGWIVGHNPSLNLDVMFDDGRIHNCHPHWKTTYYDNNGNVMKSFSE